ncbi:MAG: hypothetical protein HY650_02750 [Acidobacteria bacterium]|nr:hypothetical protein [Acidobacteriota bacterium]
MVSAQGKQALGICVVGFQAGEVINGIRAELLVSRSVVSRWIATPRQVCRDAHGNVFFSEQGNLHVRWIDTNGILRTVAGTGQSGQSSEGSIPTQSNLSFARDGGMSTDGQGNLYFLEQFKIVRFRPRD